MALLSGIRSGIRSGLLSGINPREGGGVARATITATHLATASSTTNGTVFTTASISPSSSKLVLAAVCGRRVSGGQADAAITGAGLTWVLVDTANIDVSMRLQIFRAMGTPSAGALTITWGTSQEMCIWSISEFGGVVTTGANGADAVVQATDNTAGAGSTTITGTLAALENVANAHFSAVHLNTNTTVTPDADFAELGDDNEVSSSNTLATAWAINQTASTPTFAAASAAILAVEIKAGTV
jgi:hypothetical protein